MWIRLKFAKAKAFERMKEWEKKSIHKIENDFQLSNCLQNNALFMTAFFFVVASANMLPMGETAAAATVAT